MTRILSLVLAAVTSVQPVWADGPSEEVIAPLVAQAVSDHIVPRVQAFAMSAQALSEAAQGDCVAGQSTLEAGFHHAMDDWTAMSHLRFGPTEADDRAFALAFWPDGRGKTPKVLARLLGSEGGLEAETFREVSIAGRGLYAMEFLLFDAPTQAVGDAPRRCAVIAAVADDIAYNAGAIAADWQGNYATELTEPGPEKAFHHTSEAVQELFKAAITGLQFTADTRLGRPLGTFDRPRPKRAELRRSGRPLRQVQMSVDGTRELVLILAQVNPAMQARIVKAYDQVDDLIDNLEDTSFAGVGGIQGRLHIEIIQIQINEVRDLLLAELGPALGVGTGFNALDGD
ncbi:MAG: imelysin family protein [Pelagimonas sp.]|uniref:imelysin family protein n=1 Tax=Pelagimonas sp. TaxID=2073170 RepID=UPI003D6A11A2